MKKTRQEEKRVCCNPCQPCIDCCCSCCCDDSEKKQQERERELQAQRSVKPYDSMELLCRAVAQYFGNDSIELDQFCKKGTDDLALKDLSSIFQQLKEQCKNSGGVNNEEYKNLRQSLLFDDSSPVKVAPRPRLAPLEQEMLRNWGATESIENNKQHKKKKKKNKKKKRKEHS